MQMPDRYIQRIFIAAVETVIHVTETAVGEPCRFMYLLYRVSNLKSEAFSENFVDYIPSSKNGMTESMSTQQLFYSIVVHSKPPVEEIGICD